MKQNILITGAAGEIGKSLILAWQDRGYYITCLDLQSCPDWAKNIEFLQWITESIVNFKAIADLIKSGNFSTIIHLAALLSVPAAKNPNLARQVNIESSEFLINSAIEFGNSTNRIIKFFFPSSIAVFGLNDQSKNIPVSEDSFLSPITNYGQQKLQIERFGSEKSLAHPHFDFRSLRFPGLISAESTPTSGTSDYVPLIAHNSAKNAPYSCYVRANSELSFLAMPDAISAIQVLLDCDIRKLSKKVYNLHGYTLSAQEVVDFSRKEFPSAKITYEIDPQKQAIIDSWPSNVDCSQFKADTGWQAVLSKEETFFNYLFPILKTRYNSKNI